MPFPPSTRVIYSKRPLEFVICQLRFPTILEIAAALPVQFQNSIRDRYPIFEEESSGIPKELAGIVAQLRLQKAVESNTYKFMTAEASRFISLSQEFVALSDQKYTRWETFRSELELAKRALEECYHPAFYSRIGLRYRNVIDKEAIGLGNTQWKDLLQGPLIGLLDSEDVGREIETIRTEALISVPDVQGGHITLNHALGKTDQGKSVYVVDADFFTAERTDCNAVTPILDRFNHITGRLFRWAISPQLQAALGPQPLE
jgi:uncharacterized protein (TIGR04255 family)